MQNEWLLDVLLDLKGFAEANGLTKLSAQLDLTREVAVSEISSCRVTARGMSWADEDQVGGDSRTGAVRIRA
jgi:hypothetical protein